MGLSVGDFVGDVVGAARLFVQIAPPTTTAVCFVPSLLMAIPYHRFVDPTDVSSVQNPIAGISVVVVAGLGEDVGKEDIGLSVGYFVGKLLGDTV